MSVPMSAPRRRPLGGASLAILLVLAVGGACSTPASVNPATPAASSAPGASVATAAPSSAAPSAAATASPPPSVPPVAGTGSAAKWCELVIRINTKYGYMKDKTYSSTPPTMDVWRQIVTEALDHVDEWLAATPPEIMDATTAEIAWFQAMKASGDANGWTSSTGFPPMTKAQATAMGPLTEYQKKECGIKFGG
jgi:hypothetical protein